MTAVEPGYAVRYEGSGQGADEIMGGSLSNFLIMQENANATEIAVLLNDPAAEFLAETFGQADSEEFRIEAGRVVGRLWLERELRRGQRIPPVVTISRALFDRHPDFVDEIRTVLVAPQAA